MIRIKRLFDIIASGIALVILLPVCIIAIIGIEINDFGPVFYVAKRVGKDDKEFMMLKFRSMRISKDEAVQTLRPEEDQIFAWGRIIRKFKIDEIPQLINVFIGDMSIIGPRPVAVDQIDLFRMGKYSVTKTVRPGLSGPAALYDYIYGDKFKDSDIELYKEKVLPTRRKLELVYIKKQGILFDMKMIVMTVQCICCFVLGYEPKKTYEYLLSLADESMKD